MVVVDVLLGPWDSFGQCLRRVQEVHGNEGRDASSSLRVSAKLLSSQRFVRTSTGRRGSADRSPFSVATTVPRLVSHPNEALRRLNLMRRRRLLAALSDRKRQSMSPPRGWSRMVAGSMLRGSMSRFAISRSRGTAWHGRYMLRTLSLCDWHEAHCPPLEVH